MFIGALIQVSTNDSWLQVMVTELTRIQHPWLDSQWNKKLGSLGHGVYEIISHVLCIS